MARFVRIKDRYLNVETINYIQYSNYGKYLTLDIYFQGNREKHIEAKDKSQLNDWLILLTGKGLEE